MNKVLFKSFSSGSCGNCYFLGIEDENRKRTGVLIDAGVGLKTLSRYFKEEGMDFDCVQAVLVTHDHNDHIRSLASYCKKIHWPVWADARLHKAMSRHVLTCDYVPDCRQILVEGVWNPVLEGLMNVRFFEVPHDASHTVGFAIDIAGHKYVHITDCGQMTREAIDFCAQADTVVLESNFDTDMLLNGDYPPDLKKRILNGHGHLSNSDCAAAVEEFAHEGLKNLFLCHLSEHNNTPALAYDSAKRALNNTELTNVRLITLPRQTPSPLIIL